MAWGQLESHKNSLESYLGVEESRYRVPDWVHESLKYGGFSGKRILEIGIGQGTDLIQFTTAGAFCVGVDITDNHLALTSRKFELRGQEAALIRQMQFSCLFRMVILTVCVLSALCTTLPRSPKCCAR